MCSMHLCESQDDPQTVCSNASKQPSTCRIKCVYVTDQSNIMHMLRRETPSCSKEERKAALVGLQVSSLW